MAMRAIVVVSILCCTGPSLARADEARARVLHVPPLEADAGQAIELVAVIDGAWREEVVVARWRRLGDAGWTDAAFERSSAGGWYATIDGRDVGRAGIEYYIGGGGGGD
jgi:hypothetical protein